MIRELDHALTEAGFNNAQINGFKAEVHHMSMLSTAGRVDKKLRPKILEAADAIMARLNDLPQPIPPEHNESARQIAADAQNVYDLANNYWETVQATNYTHVPDAIEKAIKTVPTLSETKKAEFLGCITDELNEMRQYLAKIA